MELSAAIAGFLTHVQVEKGLASNTQSAYRTDLAKFEDFAKKRKVALEAVNQDHLVDFLAGLYRQKLESKTVARHLVSLGADGLPGGTGNDEDRRYSDFMAR